MRTSGSRGIWKPHPQAHLRWNRFPVTARRRAAASSVGVWHASFGYEILCCIARPSRRQGRAMDTVRERQVVREFDTPARKRALRRTEPTLGRSSRMNRQRSSRSIVSYVCRTAVRKFRTVVHRAGFPSLKPRLRWSADSANDAGSKGARWYSTRTNRRGDPVTRGNLPHSQPGTNPGDRMLRRIPARACSLLGTHSHPRSHAELVGNARRFGQAFLKV